MCLTQDRLCLLNFLRHMLIIMLGMQVTSTHEYMGLVYDSAFVEVMDNDPARAQLFL